MVLEEYYNETLLSQCTYLHDRVNGPSETVYCSPELNYLLERVIKPLNGLHGFNPLGGCQNSSSKGAAITSNSFVLSIMSSWQTDHQLHLFVVSETERRRNASLNFELKPNYQELLELMNYWLLDQKL